MFDRIVAIIDGSESSQYTIDAGIAIASAGRSSLIFCVALDPELSEVGIGGPGFTDVATQMSQRILDTALVHARAGGIDGVTGTTFVDEPAHGVIALARREHAGCIVLAMKPRMTMLRPFVLSLAAEILRETTIPLYVVRHRMPATVSHRILVPIVDDSLSGIAVSYAIRLAASSRSTLVFCSVDDKAHEHAAMHALIRAKAHAAASDVTSEDLLLPVCDGIPNAIVHGADIQTCDLIVMASHVRQGMPRLIEGSVTEAVLYASNVPVIIVRGPIGVELGAAAGS